jgi:hypothetical protein
MLLTKLGPANTTIGVCASFPNEWNCRIATPKVVSGVNIDNQNASCVCVFLKIVTSQHIFEIQCELEIGQR